MAVPSASLHVQQLVELLAVVTSFPDEASAVQGAAERAAQALEAEVAAVLRDGRVVACVGYPADRVPADELVAVSTRGRGILEVPGIGECHAVSIGWSGAACPGRLLLARYDEEFAPEELVLIRGMARLLDLTLTMLRTLTAEHAMREQSERHAEANARLLASLQQRQQLLEELFEIQRAITRREPLPGILASVTASAQRLADSEVAAVWLREADDRRYAKLSASTGTRPELAKRLPAMRLVDLGAAGAAMLEGELVTSLGDRPTPPVFAELTGSPLTAMLAAPVHESGAVVGTLMVATHRGGRQYTPADEQAVRAFAEHVSLALTDARTVQRMNEAFHDSLTGLASRALFLDRLAAQLAAAQRDGTTLALLFVDLDRFKEVNDTLGHAAGDQLLAVTAARLRSQLRGDDLAARLGGDEFAAMLPGIHDSADAMAVAERIATALRAPMVVAGRELPVDASIGIALSIPHSRDTGELIRRADVAMYWTKRAGGGRPALYAEHMSQVFAEAGRAA